VRELAVRRLGRVRYAEALALQERLVDERKTNAIPDTLLLCEHDPVFTLGRNTRGENVLFPTETLQTQGYDVHEVGRGGDVTYHGPGQLVAYPILELTPDRRDVHRYVRELEEAMIRVCADYGLAAARVAGRTGCWVGDEKVGAIGVRISRWVTSHGLALNVTTDLAPFRLIVPCGIGDRGVTSLQKLLGHDPGLEDVARRLTSHLAQVLEREPSGDARPAV
jgi:lipoyl(octanoyl) transferase